MRRALGGSSGYTRARDAGMVATGFLEAITDKSDEFLDPLRALFCEDHSVEITERAIAMSLGNEFANRVGARILRENFGVGLEQMILGPTPCSKGQPVPTPASTPKAIDQGQSRIDQAFVLSKNTCDTPALKIPTPAIDPKFSFGNMSPGTLGEMFRETDVVSLD